MTVQDVGLSRKKWFAQTVIFSLPDHYYYRYNLFTSLLRLFRDMARARVMVRAIVVTRPYQTDIHEAEPIFTLKLVRVDHLCDRLNTRKPWTSIVYSYTTGQ